jgi:hypothetical protein
MRYGTSSEERHGDGAEGQGWRGMFVSDVKELAAAGALAYRAEGRHGWLSGDRETAVRVLDEALATDSD